MEENTARLKTALRTHTCGELRRVDVGKRVALCGWVSSIRTHGGVTFVDVRDRFGITQTVIPENLAEGNDALKHLRRESVVRIGGVVAEKPVPNKSLATGDIEVQAESVVVLNNSEPVPLDLENKDAVTEETRLKYRFLDLRRVEMQNNIIMRHRIVKAVRDYFDRSGFIEIETPILGKSTPEGARDYLVPSRVNKGKFYALPQSPQIFKQLCMVAGFDRYFQIAKCFRDEDLRADRQPEFTQIDVEMSFVSEEDIYAVVEGLMKHVFGKVLGVSLETPFPRMSYAEAMLRFGSDKPDLRFGLEIRDVSKVFANTGFRVFKTAECVRCIVAPSRFSRKEIDKLAEAVKLYGAKGLAYYVPGGDGGISKFLSEREKEELQKMADAGECTFFFVAGRKNVVAESLGALRIALADKLGLRNKQDDWKFVWITDFPLMEWSGEEQRYVSMHHPFTSPNEEDVKLLGESPEKVRSRAYDLTLNGTELGGGSIRIHNRELQKEVFRALKISDKEAEEKFGFLLHALSFGAPPHGGIAFGLDRLVALMTHNNNIREVIAFPKTKNAEDLMMGAPSDVRKEQLDELGIKIK